MKHLRYLEIANFVWAGLELMVAVFGLYVLPGLLPEGAGNEASHSIVMDIMIWAYIAVMTVIYVLIATRVAKAEWRIPQTAVAVLTMFTNAPFGLLYAGYAIYVCWINKETKRAFETGHVE